MPKAIQIRDVPDDVHRRLKVRAAEEGRSLAELLREHVVELAGRPTMREWLERLATDEPVEVAETSAEAVRAARAER